MSSSAVEPATTPRETDRSNDQSRAPAQGHEDQRNGERLREAAGEPQVEVQDAEQQRVGVQHDVEREQAGEAEDQRTDVPAGRSGRAPVALLDQHQPEGGDAEGAAVGRAAAIRALGSTMPGGLTPTRSQGQQQQAQAEQRRPALPAPLSLPRPAPDAEEGEQEAEGHGDPDEVEQGDRASPARASAGRAKATDGRGGGGRRQRPSPAAWPACRPGASARQGGTASQAKAKAAAP